MSETPVGLYELKPDGLIEITGTTFDEAGLLERYDLQRLLRRQIEVIAPGTLILAEEFGDWEECRRRIDLLGLDKNAKLVVIELKRGEDGGHMELQAIRYAGMVSTMTFGKAVEIFQKYLAGHGGAEDARATILKHLEWDEPDEDEFAEDVRIVLVSADFSKELTTAVMWLNERDLDIRCVRVKPYADGGRILLAVQQVIPLPEAAAYQVQIREKEQKVREDRASGRHLKRRQFWEGLLAKAAARNASFRDISPSQDTWLGCGAGVSGLSYQYHLLKDRSSIRLYIDRGTHYKELNKRRFDRLHASRAEIDKKVGSQLLWDRSDDTQHSLITYEIMGAGWGDDQSTWPAIQDAMIEAMIRFEEVFEPYIVELKSET